MAICVGQPNALVELQAAKFRAMAQPLFLPPLACCNHSLAVSGGWICWQAVVLDVLDCFQELDGCNSIKSVRRISNLEKTLRFEGVSRRRGREG
jgi:hypothetical protein